jgi:hypothetical protein
MMTQNEQLMEFVNEVVRLKIENANLKRQLEESAPVHVVRDLKNQLYKALGEKDDMKRENFGLVAQNMRLSSRISHIIDAISL